MHDRHSAAPCARKASRSLPEIIAACACARDLCASIARRAACHLLVCGAGPERDRLEAAARARACAERIHFLGERRDAGAILRDATDVLVSGSREEAFPLNVLEAGYFGVPIVATAIPPHREFVGNGRAALLVPPDDPERLSAAMEQMAQDAAGRRARGEEARRRVCESFLVSHVVGRFEAIYTSLLDAPAREFGWMRGTTWPRSYTRWARTSLSRLTRRGRQAAAGPT